MKKEKKKESTRSLPSVFTLLSLFFQLSYAATIRCIKGPFRGTKGAPTLQKDITYAVIRVLLSRITSAQSQGLAQTTEKVYEHEATKQQRNRFTIDIGNGAKGHWLGRADSQYVMIFFHGGGYVGYATPGHLKYQFALQKAIRDAGHDLSILSASYTLAPRARYPVQLTQAAEVLRYLIEHDRRDPQTVSSLRSFQAQYSPIYRYC
jgi:acetyl esterase/lipase